MKSTEKASGSVLKGGFAATVRELAGDMKEARARKKAAKAADAQLTGREADALTKKLVKQCFVAMLVWLGVLAMGLVACYLYAQSRIWYGYEPFYLLGAVFEEYPGVTFLLLFLAGTLVIFYCYWRRSLSLIDALADASEQLVAGGEGAIALPDDLHRIETRLNAAKAGAIEAKRVARLEEQRKNDLLVYLAHDLKTPLTSVIGYLQLLVDEEDIPLELRRKYAAVALEHSQRLEDLVNEFFEVARLNLSEASLELAEVNLSRMVEQSLFEYKPVMDAKELTYELDADPDLLVRCDVRKVERVFDNLLRNAVNYSWPATQIKASLHEAERAGVPGVCLRVANRGNTIAPEQLERLFEQFYRLSSSRDSGTGGAGLGLAISRGLVQAHGGTIHAESAQDTVTFVVWLPKDARR